MNECLPIDTDEYRVVLVHPASHVVCALESEGAYRLLRVFIAQRKRRTRALQKTLRDVWGLAVIVLDFLPTSDSGSTCAIAEFLNCERPAGFKGVTPEQLANEELSEQERDLLQTMLAEDAATPFANVGWMDHAVAWLETATGAKVSSKAEVEQYNAGGGFTLLRFRMREERSYWLKATAAHNTHERTVTSLLSRLCRGHVPEVIAEQPAWNAWLMCDDGDQIAELRSEGPDTLRILEGAVKSLAELQMRTMGSELDLLEAGAADHRTHVLRSNAEALFAYLGEAMAAQASTKVPRIAAWRLRDLQSLFEDVCSYVEDLELPDAVLHGDMNLGNILIAQERCVFIDWCEAYVGNPLVTFEHLLLLNPIDDVSLKTACDQHLRDTYRTAMSRLCHPRMIDAGFACMPLIATASAIFGRGNWLRTPLRTDSRRQAYVRGIARHMDRAAREPMLLAQLSV
jgi:hypothetical protein